GIMSVLAHVESAAGAHNRFVEEQVSRARNDAAFRRALLTRWKKIRAGISSVHTPTGLTLPGLAAPQPDDSDAVARYVFGEGLPREFPFVNGVYRDMYRRPEAGSSEARKTKTEEPTRLFAGLGLAEDTNQRFHFLTKHQRSIRLSTAFDGP